MPMTTVTEHLIRCGAVRFGEFTLTSGATSPYYIDVKAATCDPATLGAVAKAMADVAREHGPFDAVAGMELGAVPIATAVSLEAGLPLLMIRKGAREHGTGRRIEGEAEGKRVLVVEDVTTSGGSTVEAVRVLREAGATVTTVCVVVDRGQGGMEALSAVDAQLIPLTTAEALLEAA